MHMALTGQLKTTVEPIGDVSYLLVLCVEQHQPCPQAPSAFVAHTVQCENKVGRSLGTKLSYKLSLNQSQGYVTDGHIQNRVHHVMSCDCHVTMLNYSVYRVCNVVLFLSTSGYSEVN